MPTIHQSDHYVLLNALRNGLTRNIAIDTHQRQAVSVPDLSFWSIYTQTPIEGALEIAASGPPYPGISMPPLRSIPDLLWPEQPYCGAWDGCWLSHIVIGVSALYIFAIIFCPLPLILRMLHEVFPHIDSIFLRQITRLKARQKRRRTCWQR